MATYTVTINIAERDAPLANGEFSQGGHMWYELSDGVDPEVKSFGFAPREDHAGKPFAPGNTYDDDDIRYLEVAYSRTIEITQELKSPKNSIKPCWTLVLRQRVLVLICNTTNPQIDYGQRSKSEKYARLGNH